MASVNPAERRGARLALPRRMNLRSLAAAVQRSWKLCTAIVVAVLAAVIAASLFIPAKWDAVTLIRVEPSVRSGIDVQAASAGIPPDQAMVDTEVNLMRSRDVAARVLRSLNLLDDPEFSSTRGDVSPALREDRAVSGLLDHVNVWRDGTTYLVSLGVRSVDPRKAATIANALASEYLVRSVASRSGNATRQSNELKRQLDALGTEVRAADARLAQYRGSVGIVAGTAAGTITDQQIASLSTQLASAEASAAAAQSNLSAARGQVAAGGIDAVSGVLSSPVIGDLRRQRAEVLRKVGEANARYGPKHPESISLQQQLSGLETQLRQESNRVIGGIGADARASSASAASLRGDLSRLRAQQAGEGRASVTADSLQRDADAKRQAYNQVAQAVQLTMQQSASIQPLGHIVQAATPPLKPSFPNKPLFAVLGLVLGCALALAVVLVMEILNAGIMSPEDAELALDAPFLASLPRLSLPIGNSATPADYVAAKPMSSFAETLRTIRARILQGYRSGAIVAITSSLPAEGKTTTAISLGRVMAMSGDKVLLVDCDLRRNSLRTFVEPNAAGGMVEVLSGKIGWRDAVVTDGVTDLVVLPLRTAGFTPRDLFGGPAMTDLLAELRRHYDYVLLDTPPVLAVVETQALAGMADTVVFLTRWRQTSRHAARSALGMLRREDGEAPVNVVLTMAERRAGAMSPSDPAYYTQAYASYYQD